MAEAIIDSGARVNSTDLNGENVLFGFVPLQATSEGISGSRKRNWTNPYNTVTPKTR